MEKLICAGMPRMKYKKEGRSLKLLVLDGNSIVNRAFYGIKMLTTKDGRYTNALVGFMNILLKLEAEVKPDEVAVAFDLKAPTFRHKMYDGYKAQRKGMPQELAGQLPVLKQLLADLGYRMVTCEGFEADDILGTLSAACEARGDECVIATGDRDSLQLVGPHTRVLLAGTSLGKSVTIEMDEAAVQEKYGVTPRELIDVKSLMGDASDNIPGVAGVGEKTALALIGRFKSLEGVYGHLDDESIRQSVREKLVRGKEQAQLSRALAEICRSAPVPTQRGAYEKDTPDAAAVTDLLNSLEMFTTLEKLALDAPAVPRQPLPISEPAPLPAELGAAGVDVCMAGDLILIVDKNKVYTSSINSAEFMALLCDGACEKRCFDAKPLLRAALEAGREAKAVTFDAKLAAYLLNPAASGYDVPHLAAQYGVQPAFSCEYAEAEVLAGLFDRLAQACEEEGLQGLLHDIELPLAGVLADMEYRGILVDRAGIEAFGKELSAALDAELAAIYGAVGYEFNVNSPKQLGKALFEDLGLPTRKKTKSGYSTNAETLESLREYSPVIDHILLYRTYQKLNSTYVEGLLKVIGPDGRIHSTFNQTETRTGRISSNEPNLQNIPVRTELGSRFRRYFTAPQGSVLLDADYSQIELRVLAHLSGDEALQQAFLHGADIHRATAAKMYGVPDDRADAHLCQGRKFRHHVRQGRLQPWQRPWHFRKRGAGVHRRLSGRLPQREGLYGKDHCRRARKRLRLHPVRAPQAAAGIECRQLQHPLAGRADGHEHAHSGHGGGRHQACHGSRVPPPCGGGAARKAGFAGTRRADCGMPCRRTGKGSGHSGRRDARRGQLCRTAFCRCELRADLV